MRQTPAARWAPPAATALVWALALGCTAFWGLRLAAPPAGPAYPPVAEAPPAAADPTVIARLLGAPGVGAAPAAAVVAAAPSRFVLQGVVAGRWSGGTALIAVDGQPAQPFRIGSAVAPGVVLRSVAPRRAVLDGGEGVAMVIDMPALR
ncbi:type II secretion system protein N [uncultured Xylophilus sp.]|uniref:type II secretion system protein N n=1 Tax=uncultured Xylophilus sp. TaxID=296832 RepID=UPI0025FEBBAE|nr:type II secretion system protein N [uncultured Xylophilus sp.]